MGNGGRLSILHGSTLTHSGSALLGDQASEYGYATVDGAGSTWTNSSFVRVGNGGTGKLTISDGGRFEDTEGYLGFDPGASGTATITGAGSTWENSGALIVARKGTGSLTISDGGKATNTTGYLGTDAGGSGTATVTGTGSTWNNTQDLYVGRDGTGTLTIENIGTVYVGDAAQAAATPGYLTVSDSNPGGANGGHLHIQNGSTLTLHSYAVLGYQAGKYGYATVTGSGSTWNNDAFLFVGLFGSGTLRIESGAEVSNSTGYLGRFSGSTGTATVTGAGSSWTNSSHLYVGHAGTGDLNIQAGGKVSNDNAHVGYSHTSTVDVTGAGSAWNSSGFVSVSNGSTLTIADGGSVNIGDAAAPAGATNGWLTISDHDASGVDGGKLSIVNNSTLTHHGHAALGAQSGEYGHVLVSKPGSSWTNAGNIYVGDHGTGVLTVSEGGVVTNDTAFIGNDVGSDGQVSVMGSGSTWQNTGGGVRVGENGTGTLLVSDGATAESTLSTLGTFASGSGTATVTGAGSNWTHSGNLEVGTFGTGTLTIEAGAAVDNSNGLIAHFAGSTGQVTVTGSGSTWTNSGRLDVGGSASSEGGAGTLNVFANGRVDVTDTLRVWSTGTLNLDGGTLDATTIDHTHGGAFDFTNGTLTIDTFQGSLVQDGGTLQIGGVGMPTTVITARDKLDDFDSYATGATNTATANVWNAEPSASPNSNIVTSDQGKSLQTLGGTAWSGAERDLSGTDAAVDVGETQTFFWQVKPSYTADGAGWDYDFMMGLSPDVNHINTVDAWSDFAVMPYINNEVATPFINASGPNSPWWTQINPGEWTSVWVVVNNDSADPTYDLYIATEADPDTPILVSSDADWRGWDNTEGMPIGPNMALNAIGFMAAGNPDTQYLIDNIWYSQDVNTSNPLTHPWTNSIEFTPETTTIQGDLTLSAGATVTFDIAGSGINDLLNIAGALTADGTLQVLLESGVTLAEGDNFDLLDFGSAIGAFATLDLPDLSALGLTWDSTGLLTDGILSVVSNILAGDLNADGFVGIADLNIVLGAWNQTVPPADPSADPSGDGFVGIADLNEVLGNWNAGTPPTTSANIPEPATLILCAALLPTLTRRRPKPLAA
jgi:T5SS/PEP-CTERM-associated repeat protein